MAIQNVDIDYCGIINLLRQLLGQQRKEEEYLRSNRTYKKRMDG